MTTLQHGFRKRHSCETQLLLTLDDLIMSYNRKTQVDVAALDFSRAFNTVPHERLLGKLAHYGVKGPIHNWIRAFLTERTMWVIIDGASSPATRVMSGVPQGTVLGPLLFLIYINDLPDNVSPGTTTRLFADDCLVYWEVKGIDDQEVLQKDLQSLQEWATRWGMRFNAKKCNIIHVCRNNPKHRFYSLCGEILEVEHAKYLGVTISANLKWEKHINGITSKANSTLHFINRTLRYSPESAHQIAYFALVRSTLEYSCAVWDPHFKKDVDRLEMVNRRAARIVTGRTLRDREVSVTALLEDLKWTSLQEHRKHLRLVLMYKIVNGLVAVPATQLTPASQVPEQITNISSPPSEPIVILPNSRSTHVPSPSGTVSKLRQWTALQSRPSRLVWADPSARANPPWTWYPNLGLSSILQIQIQIQRFASMLW